MTNLWEKPILVKKTQEQQDIGSQIIALLNKSQLSVNDKLNLIFEIGSSALGILAYDKSEFKRMLAVAQFQLEERAKYYFEIKHQQPASNIPS